MGGTGSSRWNWHDKKTTVEDCYKLTIRFLNPYLRVNAPCIATWSRNGKEIGSIVFRIEGKNCPTSVRLMYTITYHHSNEKIDMDYPIPLTFTLTPWGARRYWFSCPLHSGFQVCNQRVGALYLPPGAHYFGCRHCYNLTYRSSQTRGEGLGLYRMFANAVQESMPGATVEDMLYMWEKDEQGKPPPGGYFERVYRETLADMLSELESYDAYAHYLTVEDLCTQSGLSIAYLSELESARLLLPDHDGKYRPKLVGWARKLSYLLGDGWSIDELRAWAKGRWTTPNPRKFPPIRADWGELIEK